jgi:putative peptidoglycan lipid II flippase
LHPFRTETDMLPDDPAGAGDARMVVSATLASRILGYVRDMLIAWSFGAGIYADAFIVAFRIPNLFRRLVGEGALGMAFIPVFHDHARRQGRRRALEMTVVIFRRLTLVLFVIVLLGTVFSPAIVRGLAPGFMVSGDKLQLTIHLTRIMLPYVLLVGLVALSMGVLNALGHFTAPALAPIALNVAMISAVLIGVWLASSMAMRASVLAAGVVIGGVMQLGLQVPALVRHDVRFWQTPRSETEALGRFARSAFPVMLGGATYQINVLLGTLLASYLTVGSVSYLFYADRLVQFPLGIFAISAVTVMMPGLSRQAAEQRLDAMKETLSQSLRLVWFVTMPAMVGLIVLREPIVALLFERGAFGSDSTRLTADALLWYSTGLWAYAALRILLAMFYALQDAYRPLKAAAVSVIVNLGAGVLLMRVMGHSGIALSAALAAMLNVVLLAVMLRRQIGPLGGRKMVPAAGRILGCTVLMGGAVHRLNAWLAAMPGSGTAVQTGRVVFCIIMGVAVYTTAAFLCRSRELRTCREMMFQRKKMP